MVVGQGWPYLLCYQPNADEGDNYEGLPALQVARGLLIETAVEGEAIAHLVSAVLWGGIVGCLQLL